MSKQAPDEDKDETEKSYKQGTEECRHGIICKPENKDV
jgi:hypothetical protein